MPLKIESKFYRFRFFVLSAMTTALFCLFARNQTEILTIIGIWLATLVNFYFLVLIVSQIKMAGIKKGNLSNFSFMLLAMGKLAILFAAISLGVHFMENRIIIPLLNYVVQIFILCISYMSYRKA